MNQLFPYRTEIRLETLNDIHKFVEVVSKIDSPVYLEDGENFRVNANIDMKYFSNLIIKRTFMKNLKVLF